MLLDDLSLRLLIILKALGLKLWRRSDTPALRLLMLSLLTELAIKLDLVKT